MQVIDTLIKYDFYTNFSTESRLLKSALSFNISFFISHELLKKTWLHCMTFGTIIEKIVKIQP